MSDATIRPAKYRCFDCGVIRQGHAGSASWVGQCHACPVGMLLVWELDGQPVNRGYFRPARPQER